VELSDGSLVWLNAVSSLRYPADFTGNERVVELTGEGYFEVAKNPSKPFHVKVSGGDVQVLGTHFNVNAYSDESHVRATLVEGAVKVTVKDDTKALRPGQQAQWDADDKIKVLDDINTSDEVSWKSGLFSFHRQDIQGIMRQVERWYDVGVQYNGHVKNHLTATIERNVPVSKLLRLLEGTGDVHFSIQDKTIIVNP
jgi:ferric-dicitrate binding protein FerR (iron transport regulator)